MPHRLYVACVTTSALRAARFLTVAGGLALAVAGMLTLSLPLIVAGALLWLLGILWEERASGRRHLPRLVERHPLELTADQQAQPRDARVRDAVIREAPLAPRRHDPAFSEGAEVFGGVLMALPRRLSEFLHRRLVPFEQRVENLKPDGVAEEAEASRGGVEVGRRYRRRHDLVYNR